MARPPLPAVTTDDVWGQVLTDAVYDVSDRVDAINVTGGNYTVSGSSVAGAALDSFSGADDDAKLTAALAYAAAQTIKPAILLTNREYTFALKSRQVYSGMKIIGPEGHGDQQRSANSIPCSVKFTGKPSGSETVAVWWQLPANTSIFNVEFNRLGLQGNSQAQFMATGTTSTL
jgi:hypothetical protein